MTNSHLSAPSRPKDSAIQWATTAFRLGKDKGSPLRCKNATGLFLSAYALATRNPGCRIIGFFPKNS